MILFLLLLLTLILHKEKNALALAFKLYLHLGIPNNNYYNNSNNSIYVKWHTPNNSAVFRQPKNCFHEGPLTKPGQKQEY